ncbi:hypothetical protein JCM3770_006930 [Rhodotorula araucariae]
MALDLSEPSLHAAYQDLLRPDGATDWLVLGYGRTASTLLLVDHGTGGLEELRRRLVANQVLYGLLKVEGRILLWTQIPHAVGGVKRARSLVHERTVAGALRGYTAVLNIASPAELDASAVAIRLFHQPALRQHSPASPHLPSPRLQQHASVAGSIRRPSIPDSAVSVQKPSSPRPNGHHAAFSPGSVHGAPPGPRQGSPAAGNAPASPCGDAVAPRPRPNQDFPTGYPAHLAHPTFGAIRHGNDEAPYPPTNGVVQHTFAGSHGSAPPQPKDEWRAQDHSRPPSPSPPLLVPGNATTSGVFESAAAAMLVASASDPSLAGHALSAQGIPVDVGPEDDASVALDRGVTAPSVRLAAAGSDATELEGRTRALVLEGSEEEKAARLAHERRERGAEDVAARAGREEHERATVEAEEATARESEMEGRERREAEDEYRRHAEEEYAREQAADEARRIAAEEEAQRRAASEERRRIEEEEEVARREEERILREQREAEEKRQAEEAERLRLEEEERTRRAEDEMRLLIERQRAEKQLREQEDARRREEERLQAIEERRARLVRQRDAGDVMLEGTVNVQGGGSMLWKRRYFRLTGSTFDFFKSAADAEIPVDSIPLAAIDRLTSNPEEALVPHAFKMTLKDGDERLFYYLSADETAILVEALQCALRR